jgi:hypothetical protein
MCSMLDSANQPRDPCTRISVRRREDRIVSSLLLRKKGIEHRNGRRVEPDDAGLFALRETRWTFPLSRSILAFNDLFTGASSHVSEETPA